MFVPNYRLMPLTEVDQCVKANGHLPGVPSAEQMVKQGNDLHQTDAKLLEKIEKLALHSIRQQAEIDELKRLVKQLANQK